MARKRKAVGAGNTKPSATRSRTSKSANAAKTTAPNESSSAMSATNTRPKRNPRRSAKDPWEEERLMTSSKSPLVNLDLVKLLSRPEAWEYLEESEKKEILSLLPEDAHPNPHPSEDDPDAKIPPLPETFLRYSNNWRDGIRQFQLDLESGRYDPEWLRQAEEASAQRAAGKFDKFKEREYEEFWGQKQTFDRNLAAGQSAQVKLQTLTEQGVIREGDVWKYTRCVGQGANKILLEKEVKIVSIDGPRLSFTIPSGQRVFLSHSNGDAKQSETNSQPEPTTPKPDEAEADKAQKPNPQPESATLKPDGAEPYQAQPTNEEVPSNENGAIDMGLSKKRKSDAGPFDAEAPVQKRRRGRPQNAEKAETPVVRDQEAPSNTGYQNSDTTPESNDCQPAEENTTATLVDETNTSCTETKNDDQAVADSAHPANTSGPGEQAGPAPSNTFEESDVVTVSGITSLNPLVIKIVELDGRITKMPHGNAWKEFRSYRDNQDMGSLWEVRQAWFMRTH
ncbi:uncharacterized protein KD926_001581 [Aspergillus affinis]|uniref:uncharacterized protein n=1 Tax=Aspergillus affinis TaxID=1070780 RepID=UPI0022FEB5A5|nr:uncharacterized protein KD926_001581 [Aspergillus affinis]KAI9036686.1 hypothetical protein KD926_001581 [Aspergillus affinis]